MEEALAVRDAALEALGGRLGERERRVAELGQVADRLSERVVERERELRELRGALAALQGELDRRAAAREDGIRSLIALAEDLEAVRRQARGQATRIRLRALRDAAELSDRIAELAGRPADVRERLIESLHEAISRIGAADGAEPEDETGDRVRRAAGDLFDGRIEVEIGPLGDFSQLVGFEDAAGGIGATDEISVKRFAQGRATLEMRLTEPVELLRELEQRAPFEFRVRDQRSDRLVLDVDEE